MLAYINKVKQEIYYLASDILSKSARIEFATLVRGLILCAIIYIAKRELKTRREAYFK